MSFAKVFVFFPRRNKGDGSIRLYWRGEDQALLEMEVSETKETGVSGFTENAYFIFVYKIFGFSISFSHNSNLSFPLLFWIKWKYLRSSQYYYVLFCVIYGWALRNDYVHWRMYYVGLLFRTKANYKVVITSSTLFFSWLLVRASYWWRHGQVNDSIPF